MKKIIILFITVISIIACKKYENGPSISLKSEKARIANEWVVEQYIEDGKDKTSTLSSVKFTFEKDGVCTVITPNGTFVGVWQTESDDDDDDDNKVKIEFKFTAKDTYVEELDDDWEISKLKDNEMWLIDDDNKTTILKFTEK